MSELVTHMVRKPGIPAVKVKSFEWPLAPYDSLSPSWRFDPRGGCEKERTRGGDAAHGCMRERERGRVEEGGERESAAI